MLLLCSSARSEYHNFNTAAGSDGVVQEVRWPYWAESTYNAIYSQTLSGSDGASCYFYGGMPSDPGGNPPASIIWSFWPPGGTADGQAVTAYWTATNMYAPPHVGEGASGKVSGNWPLIRSNQWYREVMRLWVPPDGTPHLGYIARWLRDSATGNWYHVATMKVPFAVSGLNGLSGFQEDFGHGNRNPRRTDYRNVYYHKSGQWSMANQFTPSVRQTGERGSAYLIENATAAYFETCTSTNYSGNLNYDLGLTSVTLTISNQPAAVPMDPIVVSSASAAVYGNQVLAQWQLPATSSPQFAYKLEVFNNPAFTGAPAASLYDIDPEARQKLLSVPGVATPYVRLTLIDIYDNTNPPIALTPAVAMLSPATNVTGAVNGLACKYYESSTNFGVLPNFSALSPVYQGAVNNPDLTLRRQRSHYAFSFNGFLDVPADGLYTFTLNSCDGSRFYVDGALVVNWDGNHSPGPLSGWAALQAGKHAVSLLYFFDTQDLGGEMIDSLRVTYAGPGMADDAVVPDSAWYRVPAGGEPTVALLSPANGTTLCGSNVLFNAAVSGAVPDKVRFYVGDNFWGEDTVAPFSLNAFVWSSLQVPLRARLFYNTTSVLDSARSWVNTTNMSLAPWLLASMSEHTYPNAGKIEAGTYTLLGDGLNLLGRQVTGDCTLIAHLAGLIGTGAAPDGTAADSSWEAGIILRESTNATPGTPLGDGGSSQYAAVYGTVNNDAHFQDHTMANAGGPYWSSGLGSANRWFKLQRVGNVFTTSVSTDGVNWRAVNTNTFSGMSATLYAGLFTYAPESQTPIVHWAAFDNVTLIGNLVGGPTATVSPTSATVFAGQNATFAASVSGLPDFGYQWQLNGIDLPGATNATLTLTNVQPADSGFYSVVVTTAGGSAASSGAALTVLTPPPAVSAILSNSPLAYLRLNEAVGPTLYDTMGLFHGAAEGSLGFAVPGVTNAPFTGFGRDNTAVQVSTSGADVAVPPFGVTTANFSLTGWVKRLGSQTDWSGLVFSRASRGAGVMVVGNSLRYSWNDNGADYNWSSGLALPDGQWAFFALTVEPSRAILYLATNSVLRSATNSVVNTPLALSGKFYLGWDPNQSSRRLNAVVDEVAFYNRTLTATQLSQMVAGSQAAVAPSVALTSPVNGATCGAPGAFSLAADVSANGQSIAKVQFFNGDTLLGEAAAAPYTWTWSNVPAGVYTLYAQAVYDGTNAVSSAPAFVAAYPLPSAPASVVTTALSSNMIALSWSPATNAAGYLVFREGTAVAAVAGTGYLDSGLAASSTYCYSVVATNQWGTSPWSLTNCATTLASGNLLAWDADSATPGPQDGDGNWGSGLASWWNGTTNVLWANNVVALFGANGGAGSVVTLTNDVAVSGVTFDSAASAYTLSGTTGALNLAGSSTFNCQADGTISAVIKGAGPLVKTGAGTLTLSAADTYTGGTTISAGTLQLGDGGTTGSVVGNITNNAALGFNYGGNVLFSGLISGNGSVTKLGSGTLSLTNSAANTYSGGTTINGGTLSLGNYGYENVNALGPGRVTINSGGTLKLSPGSTGSSYNIPNAVTLNGGTIRAEDGNQVLTAAVTVNASGGALQTVYSGKNLGLSGALSGAGDLSVDDASGSYGDGQVNLGADNSNFTGTLLVNGSSSGWSGGKVSVNHNNALRNARVVLNTARDIAFGTGVTAPVFGSLGGTGNATLPGGVTLSVGYNNATTAYSGVLQGAGALIKTGSGTFTLAGNNTYSGATTVAAGTLVVNGALVSAVTVSAGAVLGGTGVLSGPVTVNGALAPGSAAPGTLTTGAQTWNGGGRYVFGLSNLTNSAGWDRLAINGVLSLQGAAANPFVVQLCSLTSSNTPGPLVGFNRLSPYAWVLANASGGVVNFDPGKFVVDTTSFSNDWSGGSFSLALSGSALLLNYTPPPPSFFQVRKEAAGFAFSFNGPPGQPYSLLSATNPALPLPAWEVVLSDGLFSPAGQAAFTNSAPSEAQRFYRLRTP